MENKTDSHFALDGKKLSIKKEILDAVEVVKLNKDVMMNVAHRKHALKMGVLFFIVPVSLNIFLASLMFPSGLSSIFSRFLLFPLLVPVLAGMGVIFLIVFVAKKYFGGVGDELTFFRVVSYSGVFFSITVVLFLLTFLTGIDYLPLFHLIWYAQVVLIFLVSSKMLLYYCKLDPEKLVTVMAIGVVGYIILQQVLGWILVGSSYRFL